MKKHDFMLSIRMLDGDPVFVFVIVFKFNASEDFPF